MSDCPNPDSGKRTIRIAYSYLPKDPSTGKGITPNYVEDIRLFVFDSSQTFVGEWKDDEVNITDENYCMQIEVDTGTYTFIAWGNLKDCYQSSPIELEIGKTNLSDITIHYFQEEEDTIRRKLPPLYFAYLADQEVPVGTDDIYYKMPLIKNIYTISLSAEGLPVAENKYMFHISDMNGSYSFDNSFGPDKQLHYAQDCNCNEEELQSAAISKIRLARDRNPLLKFYDKEDEKVLYEANLVELILKLEENGIEIDFTNTYEFDLHLIFEEDAVTGEISIGVLVNGWKVIDKEIIL